MVERHLTAIELETGLEEVRQSPKTVGVLEMIVRRPNTSEREVVSEGQLDLIEGLVGDNWHRRGSTSMSDGSAHPDKQLTVMNARFLALIAQEKNNWQWAGDQLLVDLDLSEENLLPGTQLEVGTAVIEITPPPHNGCQKFRERFGTEALKLVSSPIGKQLHLRGLNAKVVQPGTIRAGDVVKKL